MKLSFVLSNILLIFMVQIFLFSLTVSEVKIGVMKNLVDLFDLNHSSQSSITYYSFNEPFHDKSLEVSIIDASRINFAHIKLDVTISNITAQIIQNIELNFLPYSNHPDKIDKSILVFDLTTSSQTNISFVEKIFYEINNIEPKSFWYFSFYFIMNFENFDFILNIAKSFLTKFGINTELLFIFILSPSSIEINENFIVAFEFYYILNNKAVFEKINNFPLDHSQIKSATSRRLNFRGSILKAVTAEYDDPYICIVKYNLGTNSLQFKSGFNVELLNYCEEALNFTSEPIISEWVQDNGENKVLMGVGELIRENKADISISEGLITARRLKYLKFLHPAHKEKLRAFYKTPYIDRYLYFNSFGKRVWPLLFTNFLLIGAIFKMFHVLLRNYHVIVPLSFRDDSRDTDFELENESFIWALFGASCQQGWHIHPKTNSLRVVFLVGYITGLLCFVTFSASIVSSLSTKREPIKGLNELLENSYSILIDTRSATTEYLNLFQDIKNVEKDETDAEEAVKKIFSSRYAAVVQKFRFYPTVRESLSFNNDTSSKTDYFICENIRYTHIGVTVRFSWFVNKGSEIHDFFNVALLRMIQSGVLSRIRLSYEKEYLVDCNLDITSSKRLDPIKMKDIFQPILILLSGYFLSIFVLLIEIALINLMNKMRKTNKFYYGYFI